MNKNSIDIKNLLKLTKRHSQITKTLTEMKMKMEKIKMNSRYLKKKNCK